MKGVNKDYMAPYTSLINSYVRNAVHSLKMVTIFIR